ncbi:Pycsar system effector family protein [Flavobacterium sp. K5-23]|uniref:Pycsar system effector family protein n=1 Tax=Flavobacterium sp. K5-23 TaxID=2746225 RepID=UPI00200DB7F1|nr:Pycsar system effector family protein [Flavobacterium sp. K5-23]UQD57423.1 HD domain-containing protein [Flavobacterium sp. K5-23]
MNLIDQAEDFVFNLLKDKLSIAYTYHNFTHTSEVVKAAIILSESENLSESDKETLLIATWFHDTGYISGCNEHESCSIQFASDFLSTKGKTDDYINKVATLITATTYNYEPQSILEKIIKDADYSHFASDSYLEICELLRKEWENTQDKKYADLEWAKVNLCELSQCHMYYTDYAINNWQILKEKNIMQIQNSIKMMEDGTIEHLATSDKKKKKNKEIKPERGIDTLFRVTLNNHTRLSGIADSKANILLSVNAIIISIALSSLIPKLDSPNNAHLIYPTFIMLMFSVVSIIFAILSTRPKVTSGTFSKQDIDERKVNLLFFGNFYKMPLEEYEWAINEMMKDRNYLYNSMIKDLYFLGVVLEKKYRLLRITYNIFMIGIIISVIAFVIAFNAGRV